MPRLLAHPAILLPLLFLTGAACGGGSEPLRWQLKRRTPNEGTLALVGKRDPGAMKQAEKIMKEHCQGPYTVVEESEIVVGVDTYEKESHSTSDGGGAHAAASSTRNATEWHLRYVCGAAQNSRR